MAHLFQVILPWHYHILLGIYVIYMHQIMVGYFEWKNTNFIICSRDMVGSMFAHRFRRWFNIKSSLGRAVCFVIVLSPFMVAVICLVWRLSIEPPCHRHHWSINANLILPVFSLPIHQSIQLSSFLFQRLYAHIIIYTWNDWWNPGKWVTLVTGSPHHIPLHYSSLIKRVLLLIAIANQ